MTCFSKLFIGLVMCSECVSHTLFRFLLDDGALYLSDKVRAKEIDVKKSEISVFFSVCMVFITRAVKRLIFLIVLIA